MVKFLLDALDGDVIAYDKNGAAWKFDDNVKSILREALIQYGAHVKMSYPEEPPKREPLAPGYYNIDCIEGMKHFPDNYFDLAIVDPPYGIHQAGGKNKTRGRKAAAKVYKDYEGKDKEHPGADYFRELFRVSKNQIIWGGNHMISEIPIDSPCWIIWDKENGETHFADCELAWTSFKTAARKFTFKWNGMQQGNMKQKEFRIHPNQKPVELYAWLLNNYAKPGDKILDTHVGSASSLIACHRLGFEFVGFELDAYYYAKSLKRLETEKSQLSIFDYIAR